MVVIKTEKGPMIAETAKEGDIVLFRGSDWECESFIDDLTLRLDKVITKDSFGPLHKKKG